MPAVSQQQQKFMGMVHAVQKGDMKAPSKEVEKAADSMKKSDAKDFASTKHKGLPVKKEAVKSVVEAMRDTCESFNQFVKEFYSKFESYPKTKESVEKLEEVWKNKTEQVQAQSGQEDMENDPSLYINSPDKQMQEDCGCN
jgi:uncharacterized protein Yka (UPF0111/DUF47 family)